MTEQEKNKILQDLADERNNYARECEQRIAKENGRVDGADYMMNRILEALRGQNEKKEEGKS